MSTLRKDQYKYLTISRSGFIEWDISQTKLVQKIKTHVLYSVTFFRKSYFLWDNVEKYFPSGQATDENAAHACCMLGT
jgi:hypothetical protein